ncbi:hypothetical protein F5141DRAFT_1059395 [Pisolithus sp. B1]|nr:hypothetical protein F5141DRAFT_1059395 [Pisolithus sp. B1]
MDSNSEDQSGLGGSISPGPVVGRRASTRQVKRQRFPALESEQCEEDVADVPKRKRARRGPLVGRLASLMEMPMDILFEIFGHLNPLDVLRLARTTKEFRRVLMHRSSRCIWIAARNNLPDLPDCPPYMSEPQFANLVFDTHCHECLAPNTRSVDWRLARRICMKCTKYCMVEEGYSYMTESSHLAVPSKYGKRGRPCYYKKDLDEFKQRRASLTDPKKREEFVVERRARVAEMDKHGQLLEAWALRQATARSTELEELRSARRQAIIDELTKLGWGPEIEQILPSDDLGSHRLVKQPTRLTPRIWSNIRSEMIKHMEDLRALRLQRERKALVSSRKQLATSVLRAYKRERLPFTDVMPEPMDFYLFPEVSAIIELPTETEVTEASFADVVSQLDELIVQWRTRNHNSFIDKFKDELAKKLQRITHAAADKGANAAKAGTSADVKGKGKAVDPPLPDESELIKVLSLATTVFCCEYCPSNFWMSIPEDPFHSFTSSKRSVSTTPLFYPKIMGHRCLTKGRGQDSPMTPLESISEFPYESRRRMQWTCAPLQVDKQAEAIVSNIIVACNLDPLTTTTAEMDALDPKLACVNASCVQWDRVIKDSCKASVFGWRAAFAHAAQSRRRGIAVKWKLLDENLLKDVENADAFSESSLIANFMSAVLGTSLLSGTNEDNTWLCAHCMDLPNEKDATVLSKVKSHLSAAHGVDEPQENQDYYQDYEAPQGRRNPYTPNLKITLTMEGPQVATSDDCMSDDSYDGYDGYDDYDGYGGFSGFGSFGCPCDACGDFHDEYDEYDDFSFFY